MIPLSEAQLKLAVKYILSSQTMFLETKEELKKKKKKFREIHVFKNVANHRHGELV